MQTYHTTSKTSSSHYETHETITQNQVVTTTSTSQHYTSGSQPSKFNPHFLTGILILAYHVKIAVCDIVLEEGQQNVNKEQIEITIKLGRKVLAQQNLVDSASI